MDLRSYSLANRARNKECFPQCEDWGAEDFLLAFVGGLGEACNIKKKVNRGDLTLEQAKPSLELEIGDAFCYLDHFSRSCTVSLEDAGIASFNKVSDRKNYPLKLDRSFGLGDRNTEDKVLGIVSAAQHTDMMHDKIALQSAEFDALQELAKRYSILCQVPVVDDEYPYYRGHYESAMMNFLRALKNNGRSLPPWK